MLRIFQETIIVLVGLSLCLEFLHVNVGPVILTPSKAVNALLLAVAGLEWATRKRAASHDRKAMWMLFFAGAIGIGAVHTLGTNSPSTPPITVGMQYVALFLFYLVLCFVLSTRRRLTLLLGGMLVSATIVTLSASMGLGVQTGERLGGWGGNVNHLAQNLLVALAGGYAVFATTKSFRWRVLLAGMLVVTAFGLINTFSRAGFLAVPLMLLLWMVRFGRLDLLRYAVPALVLLGIGAFFLPESVIERVATLSPDEIEKDGSAVSRLHSLPWIFKAFFSNPIIGVGLANFAYWSLAESGSWIGAIHNAFLNALAELGIVGFIPMMVILVFTWGDYSRSFLVARRLRRRRDPDLVWIEVHAVMLQVGLLSVLVMSMFHPTMTKKTFWLLFAASTVLWRLTRARYVALTQQEEEQPPQGWEPLRPALGPAAPALRSRSS